MGPQGGGDAPQTNRPTGGNHPRGEGGGDKEVGESQAGVQGEMEDVKVVIEVSDKPALGRVLTADGSHPDAPASTVQKQET